MNTKIRFISIFTLALLIGVALWATLTQAAPGNSLLAGGSPTVVAYQGEVRVSGAPYTGGGYFKFAVVDAAGTTSYWSNDGTSAGGEEPTASVQLTVTDGLFSLLLGDTALGGMTQALAADVFDQPDRYLRVWFSSDNVTYDQLTPDTRIAAVPYALQAQEAVDSDTVDGLHAGELETHYQNVVIVAQSGGDYTSVQAAIDSITDASADNPYLVWVAPGVYSEIVTMNSFVHIQGAGQEVTIITSTASSSAWPPDQATLILASDTSLRDLSVGNSGAGDYNAALLATVGMTRTRTADVTAKTQGNGVRNCGIALSGSGTGVILQQVTALGENGSEVNYGLCDFDGAAATLRGGSFTGRGGVHTRGIFNYGNDTTLEAESATVLAENGSAGNYGLANHDGAAAVLRGGSITGRGGTDATTIYNIGINTTLEIESVIVLAENGSDINIGLVNRDGAAATLRGGSFTGRGGTYARGIYNRTSGSTLEADSVTALGENGTNTSYGLYNNLGSAATLRGGSFTGYGGTYTRGIYSYGSDTTLEAASVTALGENASDENYGLTNWAGAKGVLRGGSFTARGGTTAQGIHNNNSDTTLEAESVTALGENGSNTNYGLANGDGAEVMLHGGSFAGHGGSTAYGIYNDDDGSETTLEAKNVTALGEDGSSSNYGLRNNEGEVATLYGGSFTARGGTTACGIYNFGGNAALGVVSVTALGENGSNSNYGLHNYGGAATADSSHFTGSSDGLYLNEGTVRLGVSQLDGGATRTGGGTLTCFQVYDETYATYTCP